MQEPVTFVSDGLKLAGIVHIPDDIKPGERRPAIMVLHGFGGTKDGGGAIIQCEEFASRGYVALRFDYRGCGESEGEHGWIICMDQVSDTSNALTYMASRPDVEPDRIGVIGSSFGGAVGIYTAGVDPRVAAVISCGGWGDGERKFRGQHSTPEAWKHFQDILEEGEGYRERTGESMMVPRYDIVPIPEHLRVNLTSASIDYFPWETVRSMYDFRADDVVGQIAPRPLILLHSAKDSVTPTEQSIELFKRAGQPADLHLLANVDHFMFNEGPNRVWETIDAWLAKYFPVKQTAAAPSA